MTYRSHARLPLDRRSLLRVAIALTAATAVPIRRGHAGEVLASTGETVYVSEDALKDLQRSIAGAVVLPSSANYDAERRLWSPAIDHKPAIIAKCTSLNDIQAALQFARSHNLLTALRCGGHNYDGTGMSDGGITLDLSPYRGVEVDQSKMRAYVKGGSILRNLDEATVPLGVATTAGVVSHTGVGGLATGIGQGRLARLLGYAIDNNRGVEVLTADGELVRANASENSDLFWAVRGGGGNFGIVTEFQFQLYDFDPLITSFSFTYPVSKAADALKTLFELGDRVSNEMSLSAGVRTGHDGVTTSTFGGTYNGSPEAARKILDPYLAKLGEPIRTRFDGVDYLWLQGIADGDLLSKSAVYYQSGFFNRVDEKIADAVADYATKHTYPGAKVNFSHQAGKTAELASDATAYPYRDTLYQCTVDTSWRNPADGPGQRAYCDETWKAIRPMGTGGFYVNLAIGPTEADVRDAYGPNYARLVKLKDKYDPDNFFRTNVNIKPSRAT